jgi:DNA topoisomerase-1
LVLRTGRKGKFLGCSGYPECTYTKNVGRERQQGKRGGLSPAKAKPSGETCEKCGKPMVIRAGRWGPFLACSGYPQCRNTKRMSKEDKAEPAEKPEKRAKALPADKPTELICPRCGQPLAERRRGLQKYRVCTNTECSYREPVTKPAAATGVPCPQAGCDGELVERRGRWGKFFGCSNYPRCRYTARELPGEAQDTGSRPPESPAPRSPSGKSRPAATRTRKPRPSAGQA